MERTFHEHLSWGKDRSKIFRQPAMIPGGNTLPFPRRYRRGLIKARLL